MEKNIINKGNKDKFLLKIVICLVLLLIIFLLPKYSNKSFAAEQEKSPEFVYLSDIQYSSAKVGWGKINLDGTDSGAEFSIKIEGGTYNFNKGIWAHASSEIVYNLTDYQDYDYFTTYMGVNATSGNRGNGVKFYIYTSTDGKQWNLKTEAEPQAIMSLNNARFVKIDIKTEKFLKLVANDNGANGNDHSVYVDAKLIKETYKEPGEELVPSIEKLDQKIKNEFANANLETNPEYELTILKRELIDRVGNYALRKFLSASEANEETYTWLTSNVDVLRLYILGGTPEGGNYYNSLTQLSRLYNEYKDDFTLTEKLNNKWNPEMTYGDLYKKMAISLSLTHSQNLGLWMQAGATENKSDALERYAIYKYMHKNGKFRATDNLDITPWFEALHVEEMRFVMNNLIDDEEILWLNSYVQDRLDQYKTTNWLTPHPYIAYVWPNYGNEVYYNEENRQYFNELFAINKKDDNKGEELANESGEKIGKVGLFDTKFTIPGGKNTESYEISVTRGTSEYKLYKVWMNFRNKFGTGCVCGGISKSGSNIRTTHGIPATVIGQPGHAALLCYSKNDNGQGYWGIDNDVSGWTLSEKGERMLLGWGNASYSRGYSVVYMVLAQEAINDFENLVKCEELVYLAKVYSGNLEKQEEIYEKALEIQPINIDAWVGLINIYNQSKTEDKCYELAERLAENLKCFPLPMQHLTNLIKPKLTSVENIYKFTLLQTRILEEGSKLPNTATDQVLQPAVTRVEANYLLGKLDKTIATFSFDGVDAGKIVLSSSFDGNGVRWDYCLTGKGENENWQDAEWQEVSFTAEEEHKLQLTQEEIAKITAENDIYIHIVGVNYDEENLYKIDITQQTLPNDLYANDLENRVVGTDLGTEWKYTQDNEWTSYSVTSPDLVGNKTVQVRKSATGTKLASEISEVYTFTEDNQLDTRKYIRVSHLSIEGYSTQSVDAKRPFYAPNAIDGNINTIWHTDFRYNVLQQEEKPFIIIKLDEPRYISGFEFIQTKYKANDPDFIKNGIVYISEDKEQWTEAGRIENCPQNNELRSITFNQSVYGQYVKLEIDTYNMFASIAMINLFEDITKIENIKPTAGIYYSTQETTNQYVVARLTNPSTEITITNNNGKDTYIFTENGEFTFEFVDKKGNKGSAIAKVTWIDKNAPTAEVKYKLDNDKKLLILLDNISEDVYLLDENNNKINYVEVENGKLKYVTYLDNSERAYKTVYVDENENTKKIAYKNTTGQVQNVEEYVITLKTENDENQQINIGEIEKEEYFDSDGNNIKDISDSEKEILRSLQQTARSNPLEYVLEESGEYEFRLLDKANNIAYNSIKVDYIDNNKILASNITYDITRATNKDVIAKVNPYIVDVNGNKDADVVITSDNGKSTHTFTENGEFTFEYKDSTDTNNWNIKQHKAKVDWIDKTAPTAQIKYSISETTNKPVVATLINESEEIIVTNNNGSREYTFTENGKFTFEFEDKVGNKATVEAKVDWIEEKQEIPEPEPTPTPTPDPVQLGDINKDKKITVTDLLLLKRHLVAGEKQEWVLTENEFVAGDINKDEKITATDLILLKRLVLNKIEIH